MLCFLAKPPKHYEEFVSWHFRRHGETILLACRAYMDGYAKVGGQTTEYGPSADIITSKNFKSSMKILYPKLSAAFMKNECSLKKYFAKEAPLHCCTGFKLQVRKENRKLDEAFSANCFEGK
ncbi:(E3-independent) E2 ubiquitin-conjugating enzyme [Ranunculus cassubicifolius]